VEADTAPKEIEKAESAEAWGWPSAVPHEHRDVRRWLRCQSPPSRGRSVLLFQGLTEMGRVLHGFLPDDRRGARCEPGGRESGRPDTDVVPSRPTVGSRSSTLMGNAILIAAEPSAVSPRIGFRTPAIPVERLVAKNERSMTATIQTASWI